MAIEKKLDTFLLRDQYDLSTEKLNEQAQVSAFRRAELMGWRGVRVKPSGVPPTLDGKYKCYSFEIWGFEIEPSQLGDSPQENSTHLQETQVAAREANL